MSQERQMARILIFPSELGWMAVALAGDVIVEMTFGRKSPDAARQALRSEGDVVSSNPRESKLVHRFQRFAAGADDDFLDVPIDTEHMTAFQRRVTELCRNVPVGETLTYEQLAQQAGSPRAARAVGNVMAQNRFPLIVPCHRIVGASGSLGGYSAPDGLRTKRKLLQREGALETVS